MWQFLWSGDEDLREAARHAQGYGVSLCLVGMPSAVGQSQSKLLVLEADHHLVLDPEVLVAHLRSTRDEAPTSTPGADLAQVVDELAKDPRSRLDPGAGHVSLFKGTDSALVARLAQLTGQFPVDSSLLQEVRGFLVARLQGAATDTKEPGGS